MGGLSGKVAGVQISSAGNTGTSQKVLIRGISSFSGNTSPLVLVDGVERSLNDIDPAEIESFSVLKDASASAMYGVRGANGVILINTKRGSVSAPFRKFTCRTIYSAPTKLPQFIGAAEYMSFAEYASARPEQKGCLRKTRF